MDEFIPAFSRNWVFAYYCCALKVFQIVCRIFTKANVISKFLGEDGKISEKAVYFEIDSEI